MKYCVSNIAWSAEHDEQMYGFLRDNNFDGIEIAPTRIFADTPYDKLDEARDFARRLKQEYGLEIASMQSIWYGISESIFGSEADRSKLVDYTKKAIDFACVIDCGNLVFGCPKNRAIPEGADIDNCLEIAHDFFNKIGDYAAACGACVAIEPNPPIYNTNFINTFEQAFKICRDLDNSGIKVNADIGTFIYYNADINILKDNIDLINHVHISEPYLAPIETRELHGELKKLLTQASSHSALDAESHEIAGQARNDWLINYDKYISLEMANINDIEKVKEIICYIKI